MPDLLAEQESVTLLLSLAAMVSTAASRATDLMTMFLPATAVTHCPKVMDRLAERATLVEPLAGE